MATNHHYTITSRHSRRDIITSSASVRDERSTECYIRTLSWHVMPLSWINANRISPDTWEYPTTQKGSVGGTGEPVIPAAARIAVRRLTHTRRNARIAIVIMIEGA